MVETIAIVITAIGVMIGCVSLRGAQLQRNRQFESLYVQRYWALMDKLSHDAGRRVAYTSLGEHDRTVLQHYLRLCEDQIEMRGEGAITRSTYRIWASGMYAALSSEPVAGAWAEARDEVHPLTQLRLLSSDPAYDPDRRPWVIRWLAGVK